LAGEEGRQDGLGEVPFVGDPEIRDEFEDPMELEESDC